MIEGKLSQLRYCFISLFRVYISVLLYRLTPDVLMADKSFTNKHYFRFDNRMYRKYGQCQQVSEM